jgi:coenzyme F420 hydrogenase subunit beta
MLEACFARSRDPEIARVGQDGGAVTAILDSLIRADGIDCAVVSIWNKSLPWKPVPSVALDRESVLAGAGTKYTPSATLIGLRNAAKDFGSGRIAVVGTPCQVRAIRKIQNSDVESTDMASDEFFVIGLFCMESYSYDSLIQQYLPSKGVDPALVTKFSIKKGRFIAQSGENEKINVPLKEMKSNVRSACNLCRDFTAEFADLSVGSVDAPQGWSTLIIRDEKALDAVRKAEKSGLIEIRRIENPTEELKVTHALSERKSQHIEKTSG